MPRTKIQEQSVLAGLGTGLYIDTPSPLEARKNSGQTMEFSCVLPPQERLRHAGRRNHLSRPMGAARCIAPSTVLLETSHNPERLDNRGVKRPDHRESCCGSSGRLPA